MRVVWVRFAELIITSTLLSAISSIIHFSGIYGQEMETTGIILLAAFAIFLVYHIYKLRLCFYVLHDKKRYYRFNFAAYLMFMIFSLLVYLIFGNVAYTWMFSIFKVARFCNLQLSIAASAIASHVVMLAAIALAPLGMDWIFEFDRDK